MTPSSPGIRTAALISSLQPSNFDSKTGFFVVQNLSLLCVAGLISAAILNSRHPFIALKCLLQITNYNFFQFFFYCVCQYVKPVLPDFDVYRSLPR